MTKHPDVSHIRFSSTVFPSHKDMKLWESLSYEERLAVEHRDEEEGRASGLAKPYRMADIIAEAKAEMKTK